MSQDEVQTSYAEDVERIQAIIAQLSQKDCDIDKMLEYVKEATQLITRCQTKLAKTGLQIEEVLKTLDASKVE